MTAIPEPSSGVIDGGVHRYALRVYYEDTDAGGVVYHANYLRWFERARSDLLERLDIDQRAALDAGEGLYTVAEAALRYRAPARLGDVVVIETFAERVGRVSCTLRQVAWRGEVRLCDATIKVGFIRPDGRPRGQPAAWQQAFDSLVAGRMLIQTSASGPDSCPEGQE
ncbi:YbgC/FadM family acyl-CoA thioesterase [Novosphingobium endophyticum]|uniref:YbgC/FadM family acyl-CoA thioesterase n=1 Tax=Novosphingobium endophyticum TaxID=1955250 RepID=UPI00166B2E8A|nr:YbgC/FadM family acyl-CoA thioesterase [Novosphingobium endophyticum]